MRKLFLILLLFISYITLGQGRVLLMWDASTDNVGVAGYCVWVDGVRYDSTEVTQYEFNFEAGDYVLTVSAYDAAGNESAQSEPLSIKVPDVTVPAIPTLISVEYHENVVKISWLKSTDNVATVGYNIYINGIKFDSTNQTFYEFENIIPDSEYKVSISAVDNAGNESQRSKEFDIKFPDDNLKMELYPNPNSRAIFHVDFDGGIIKDNSILRVIDMFGKVIYERQIYAGTTPHTEVFDLRNLLVDGTYGVILYVDGKRTLTTRLVVIRPRTFSVKYQPEEYKFENKFKISW